VTEALGAKLGPLQGIRIVDASAVMSGPLAATLLADQGAEVVKVERPGIGDILRYVGTSRNGMSATFHVTNRGKRSIALNLAEARGIEILKQLIASADVFIQNFRPGVAERMGFGWETARELNPRLVYVSISGFGPSGPYAQKRVYDNVIQACSGMNDAQAEPETNEPQAVRQLICDKLTAYTAAQAITAALLARERGGSGQHVELAMLDTAIGFLWPDAAVEHTLLESDVIPQPPIGRNYRLMTMSDGWATATPLTDSEFQGLCRAFGLHEAAADPRFASVMDRMKNVAALSSLMQDDIVEAAASMTCDEVSAAFDAEDVPSGIVTRLGELHEDPQVIANGILVESKHPAAGRLREPRPAPRFGETPAHVGAPAPGLGEHTDEVLAELGLADEVSALRESGIVA
jgi:crotonobetainyl-CoA:carnitine CoA-transferase CaiB-like acyl-CoA transferase